MIRKTVLTTLGISVAVYIMFPCMLPILVLHAYTLQNKEFQSFR